MGIKYINNQSWDSEGNLVLDEWIPIEYGPLDDAGVAATLNVVLGLWSLDDAAHAVKRDPEHLIAEAEAWGLHS